MRNLLILLAYILCTFFPANAQDDVKKFKELLSKLKTSATNKFFSRHYEGIIQVVESKNLTKADSGFISQTYSRFLDETIKLQEENTYKQRLFPIVFSWASPTDNAVSFGMLRLPKNWNPEEEYPLYIQLHGLWHVAANPIDFMTISFRNNPNKSYAYEDGYMLDAWGRGNLWYQGISEIDIWEAINEFENFAKINRKREYLIGHSMGGFGTWYLAGKSVGKWAGIGLYAGALQYDNSLVNEEMAEKFIHLPVYFVCGTTDWLLPVNTKAYNLLSEAGNPDIEFVTFEGGHDYLMSNVEKMYDWLSLFTNENPSNVQIIKKLKIQVGPNPFKKHTIFNIDLEIADFVTVNIYDLNGRKIARLKDNYLNKGENSIVWVPENVSAGIYFYEIISNSSKDYGKLIYY